MPAILELTYDQVLAAASSLTEKERSLLIAELTEQDQPKEAGYDEAWRNEIERRLAEIDSGKVKMVPIEEVYARMEARKQAAMSRV